MLLLNLSIFITNFMHNASFFCLQHKRHLYPSCSIMKHVMMQTSVSRCFFIIYDIMS